MRKIFAIVMLMGTLASCKNDLDVNAPWKETAVIYGLLDMGDTAQYIRVERIYQNDGTDAIKAAQIGDSLYFDTIVVELTARDNAGIVWVERLIEDNSLQKASGIFANSPTTVYKTNKKLLSKYSYSLRVYSPKTGKEYTSSTQLVGNCYLISQPLKFSLPPYKKYTLSMFTGQGALAYDVKVRMLYREYDSTNVDSTDHLLDWVAVTNLEANARDLYPEIIGRSMYDYIAYNLKSPGYKKYRKMTGFEFYFIGGGAELMNYININKPSLGIIQKKPEYSNINNGLGLFSSRNTVKNYFPASDSVNYFLVNDSATRALGFRFK